MAYKLVKDELRQISGKSTTGFKIVKYITGFAGIVAIIAGTWMLVGIERKLDEKVVDASYSSTPVIIISLVLLAAGMVLIMLSYYFQSRSSVKEGFIKGTDGAWVNAYLQQDNSAQPGDEFPLATIEEPPGPACENKSELMPDTTMGVAFCPECKKIVTLASGVCPECRNPVVKDE